MSSANYNPYTTAPNTAHILWTKPVAFGGTIGGEFGGSETSNFYSTSQYEPKFAPIIMNGILYYTMYPGASNLPIRMGSSRLADRTNTVDKEHDSNAVMRSNTRLQYTQPVRRHCIPVEWDLRRKWDCRISGGHP